MRKIIHIDMDCFYAAVEIHDHPELKGKPVAVGGEASRRGILCTCNYEAREYGVHSAMPTFEALRLCPELILRPMNGGRYREISLAIHRIFHEYTDLIEPLSLDEAFLDVTQVTDCQGSATWMAEKIRECIFQQEGLTASAGIAPNKFLAKIASDWNKPNGQLVITPEEISAFVKRLPVKKIPGVGKVTAQKLDALGIRTCADMQTWPRFKLVSRFGKFGGRLHELAQGIDEREVIPERIRKSVSTENTFPEDLATLPQCKEKLSGIFEDLTRRLRRYSHVPLEKQFIKIKFCDFTQTTVERVSSTPSMTLFHQLLEEGFARGNKPVRLLGLGVRFCEESPQLVFEFP